jgi:hypothetical protein
VRIGESHSVSIDFGNIQVITKIAAARRHDLRETDIKRSIIACTQRPSGIVTAAYASFVGRDITNLPVVCKVFGGELTC